MPRKNITGSATPNVGTDMRNVLVNSKEFLHGRLQYVLDFHVLLGTCICCQSAHEGCTEAMTLQTSIETVLHWECGHGILPARDILTAACHQQLADKLAADVSCCCWTVSQAAANMFPGCNLSFMHRAQTLDSHPAWCRELLASSCCSSCPDLLYLSHDELGYAASSSSFDWCCWDVCAWL